MDQPLLVRDANDSDAGSGKVARRRATHRAEPLHHRGRRRRLEPAELQGGKGGLGDAVATDQLAEADPVDGLRERHLQPLVGGIRAVVDQAQRRLRRRPDALLGEDLVHHVLADTEVLTRGEERLDQRLHRTTEPSQHLARPRVVGVAVDPALGAAQRDVPVALGV